MHTAMLITLGFAGYCVASGAVWAGLASLVRRGGSR